MENLLPQPATVFHLTDLVPMVNSVKNQLFPWRKSPLDPELREVPESPGRSQFLRGWLTEEETREVLARCQQDEISLHGVILAAGLQAMARICRHNNSQQLLTLRASVLTNLNITVEEDSSQPVDLEEMIEIGESATTQGNLPDLQICEI